MFEAGTPEERRAEWAALTREVMMGVFQREWRRAMESEEVWDAVSCFSLR